MKNPWHARRDAVVYRKSHFKRLESTCEVLDLISICRRSGVCTRGRGCSGGVQPSGDSRFMHFIFRRTLIPRRTTWPTGVILNLWSEIIFDHGSVIGPFFLLFFLFRVSGLPWVWNKAVVPDPSTVAAVYSTDRFIRGKTWGNGPRAGEHEADNRGKKEASGLVEPLNLVSYKVPEWIRADFVM